MAIKSDIEWEGEGYADRNAPLSDCAQEWRWLPLFYVMVSELSCPSASHLAKQKVIVKNLAAMQNVGSIDILCSDKTGTLTNSLGVR